MSTWNHAFDFAFELKTNEEDTSGVTGDQLRAAIQARLNSLTDEHLVKACNCFDSHEEEELYSKASQ